MLLFIDESGDAGLKVDCGSSALFCVALIIFEENEEAAAADRAIASLRQQLRFDDKYEFHFSKCGHPIRERFLTAVASHGFFYHAIIINKKRLKGPGFHIKESFYKYACSLVFENAKPLLSNATVILDGSGSREFRKQLATYLRRKVSDRGGKRLIGKIKVQDSISNNLLQLADMVCGAVSRSYSSKTNARKYRRIISHRELRVQFWPR
jgi:hypothetical protein